MKKTYHSPPHRFCPWCGHPLPRIDPYRQECSDCGFILYHSSSPCMGAVPLDPDNRVLLARRGIEPFKGDWNTIGGFLNYNEDPIEGLKREVLEETGVNCSIGEFISISSEVYGPGGKALLCVYFTVTLAASQFSPQDDVSELTWFSLDNLPDNIAFKSDLNALLKLKKRVP